MLEKLLAASSKRCAMVTKERDELADERDEKAAHEEAHQKIEKVWEREQKEREDAWKREQKEREDA
eukprot:COSAG01_NODE_54551_length_331_cov_0.892241_2_plen_65_part_01